MLPTRYRKIRTTPTASGRPFASAFPTNQLPGELLAETKKLLPTNLTNSVSVGQNTVNKVKSLANECNFELNENWFTPRQYPLSEQFSFRVTDGKHIEDIITSMLSNKAPGNALSALSKTASLLFFLQSHPLLTPLLLLQPSLLFGK